MCSFSRSRRWLSLVAMVLCPTLFAGSQPLFAADKADAAYDVVVYGATAGGAVAAVQAAKMGKSVVLIEPGKHVGGLTSGGLGATDIGNKQAIGGLSRSFYRRVGEYYANDSAWKYQTRESYQSRRRAPDEVEMWTFEPHVAEKILREMLAEQNVPIVFQERLDLKNGVTKEGTRIVSIRMESGRTFRGKMYIDATYEGDLMAKAGVTYHVGREGNKTYGETLNGVQVAHARYHQFTHQVDPYVVPGDPSSGLLPGVHGDRPGVDGEGDHRVQAYCFRMCTTDVVENQREWVKPADYDPLRYELALRNVEAGDHRIQWAPSLMPNRKTDTNNNFAISTDNIGMNYDYPDGDYETRERIFKEHLSYQQGLMWTMANHPRVPEKIRKAYQRLKPTKDEFPETDGWPHQLYVREARRMISDYVMTQHNCQGRELAEDSVGLAAYTMDSHHVQRYVDENGFARNEGDVQVGGFSPYPISYRSIRPKAEHCTNLLVPICLSASHIAYGSIRMEPVFMVLGQSAATAACHAIDDNRTVQEIDIEKLQARLLEDEQVLEWSGPRRTPGVISKLLKGHVVDDEAATLKGEWLTSSTVGGFVDRGYRHDNNEGKGQKTATFDFEVKEAGQYDVRLYWTTNANRATNVPVTISTGAGRAPVSVTVNQREAPESGAWKSLGKFSLEAGQSVRVVISNEGTNGHVIIDAVHLAPVK